MHSLRTAKRADRNSKRIENVRKAKKKSVGPRVSVLVFETRARMALNSAALSPPSLSGYVRYW